MYAVIDCNNFFVSCERIFRPELEKKPVVVLSNNDGCIISRSSEVKKLGVAMGAPAFEYKEIFKEQSVAVFSSNFPLYADISSRVMQTIASYVPTMEVYSIDEAFVRFDGFSDEMILRQCHLIKESVQKWVGMPVSIGIGSTMTRAKAANEIAKKEEQYKGIFALTEANTDSILWNLLIEDVWGIGRKLKTFFNNHNILNALQLKSCDDVWIKSQTSKSVLQVVWELRGIPCIKLHDTHIPKKSIVSSRSFGRPVTSKKEMKEAVAKYASRVAEKLREEKEVASCITVYMITNRHNLREKQYTGTATITLSQPTNFTPLLIAAAHEVVQKVYKDGFRYKKAAVLVTGLMSDTAVQQNLFKNPAKTEKEQYLMQVVDKINHELGTDTLHFASQGYKPRWAASSLMRSKRFTTNWKELRVVSS